MAPSTAIKCLGAAQRVHPELGRSPRGARADHPAVGATCARGGSSVAATREQKLAWLPVGQPEVLVDRRARLLGQPEPHGLPVVLWQMVARSSAWPLGAASSTRTMTTSQPRSLLSIASLNSARSRLCASICSLVRIDQTWLGRRGGLAPISLPKVSGARASRW